MEELKSTEFILSKINELKSQGYDRIHLPGGTSIDGSFYSGVILAKYDSITKDVYFLGVPYCSSFHLNGRSNHNKKIGEVASQAALRELFEETGIQTTPENLDLVLEKKIPDNRSRGTLGQFHFKYFYLVTKFMGNMFNFDGPNPIDGETAAPLWIPANLFVKTIFKGHLEAVNAAIEKLMNEDRQYAHALMNLV